MVVVVVENVNVMVAAVLLDAVSMYTENSSKMIEKTCDGSNYVQSLMFEAKK